MKNFPFNTARLVQSVIGKQPLQLERWEGKTLLSNGYYSDTYSEPVTVYASVQAVSSEKKKSLGLEMASYYINIVSTEEIEGLTRTSNPDRAIFNGWRYMVVDMLDNQIQGGWSGVLMVRGDRSE